MSSSTNNGTTVNGAVGVKATSHPLIETMTSAELEAAFHTSLATAKKVAWQSEVATPEALTAMLAMYAIQEVHALGYRPPSAIRAMVMKIKADENIPTNRCLRQAKREIIKQVKEKRGEVYEEPKPRGSKEGTVAQAKVVKGKAADGKA